MVIDEAHAYKGAFGCHTSFILRRLGRLCSHGTRPLAYCGESPAILMECLSFKVQDVMLSLLFAVYGTHPTFVLCTATLANARDHSMVRCL